MADWRVDGCLAGAKGRAAAAAARRVCAVRLSAALVLVLVVAIAASILRPPRPLILWNASSSTAPGLYLVTSAAGARAGDIVIAWPPQWARRLTDHRLYLPAGVPLVKPVAAAAGDRVCAVQGLVFVNGRAAAARRSHDPRGRPMPWWHGCRPLGRGELFLLSAGVGDAFDGRYFGVTRASDLIGKARLLWAKPAKGSNDG